MKHQVKTETLKNGARVLWIDVPSAKYVICDFHFEAGYRYARPEQYDLPHVLEHLFVTPKGWNEADFLSELIKNGAYYGAWTNDQLVRYEFQAPKFDWERVMDLVISALDNPKFEPEYFKKELSIVETELEDCLNHHSRLIYPVYAQATGIAAQTYADRLKNLKNITLADIQAYYPQFFTTDNLDVVICGDLQQIKAKLKGKIEALQLPRGQRQRLLYERRHGGSHLVYKKDVQNIDFTFVSILERKMTIRENTAMRFAIFALFSSAKSRIYSKARERGIVYSICGGRYNTEKSADFYIDGEVSHKNAQDLFKLVASELQKVIKSGFTESEIERARQAMLGDLSMEDVTPRGMYNFYRGRYWDFGELDDFNDYEQLVQSVTLDEVNQIAREFIASEKKVLVAVSDCEAEEIEKLGAVLGIAPV